MDALRLPGRALLRDTLRGGQAFRWRPAGDAWSGTLGATPVLLAESGAGVEVLPDEAAPEAAAYLGLGRGYGAALARIARDPALAPDVARFRGLRLLRQDPWEALVAFIVSANNNVLRIEGILERLAEAAGERRDAPWGARHAFPAPRALARLGEARLRDLGLGYRAPFVAEAARRVARGLDLAALRRARREDAREALLELPGVGPKVADCILAFSLGHGDAFPVDRHVARAVAARWPEAPAAYEPLAAWAREKWGKDAALAQQFVFHAERVGARPAAAPAG